MSIVVFILIGLMAGQAGALLLERKRLFSIRYILTGLTLSLTVGTIASLLSGGLDGLSSPSAGPVLASFVAAVAGVGLLKLSSRSLNYDTDADIPWSSKSPEKSREIMDKREDKDKFPEDP